MAKSRAEYMREYRKRNKDYRQKEAQRVRTHEHGVSVAEYFDVDYQRRVATTPAFLELLEQHKDDLWQKAVIGGFDKMAYVLAAMIGSYRLHWHNKHGYMVSVPWGSICRSTTISRSRLLPTTEALKSHGIIKPVPGQYEVVVLKSGKRKLAWPKGIAEIEQSSGEYDWLGVGNSENIEEEFPGAHVVQFYNLTGCEDGINWSAYDLPYYDISSSEILQYITCNTTNPDGVSEDSTSTYLDPLLHGIDWMKAVAVAQRDIHNITVSDEAFEFDADGFPVDLSEEVKNSLEFSPSSLLSMAAEARRESYGDELLYQEVYDRIYAEKHKHMCGMQFSSALIVYEGRVLVRQLSNARIHNCVSALKPEVRSYLINRKTGEYLVPRDVNNAGIASAVYKVSHLADKYPDVRQFINDAKDGTFYQKAYDWLAAHGTVFELPYEEGGKAEVKYGTRAGRTDYDSVCSGVLPHLYHSGNAAYDWLASVGCDVSNSNRRNAMHEWAYANYPHVYEVLDGLKRQVAQEWLHAEVSSSKFRRRYLKYSRMAEALKSGSTPEDVAHDWVQTYPLVRTDPDGNEVAGGYRSYLLSAQRVQNGLDAGKSIFQIALPSATSIRESKITSTVSRSIHDCETAGQWQGVLAFKETYPDSVVVSIHDCIMTDTDPEYLGECLVWGWANSLYDAETDTFFGVDISVDEDEH